MIPSADPSGIRRGFARSHFGDPARWDGLTILTREVARQQITERPGHYYIYVLCQPDGTPFYVGKGRGQRVFQHEAEACNPSRRSHKCNLIRRIQREGSPVGYVLDSFYEIEADSLVRERELIACFGRYDLRAGPLTNQIDGGEGAANPSVESRARHAASLGGEADDPERRVANRFLAAIAGGQDSVPIKPWQTLRRRAHLLRPSPNKPVPDPTSRMAKAIVASAVANRVVLEPGAILPRRLVIDGVECAIENGCGGDMIHAGMVEPVEPRSAPLDENLRLTMTGHQAVVRLIGADRLIAFGLIDP
jgi:hypothetical protein